MNNWEIIYSTNKDFEAYIVEDLLNDNSIPAVVLDQQDSIYKFGEFKVLVQQENVLMAKQLLSEMNKD